MCSYCQLKGATISCFEPKCSKSFHIKCSGRDEKFFTSHAVFWCYKHKPPSSTKYSCNNCNTFMTGFYFSCRECRNFFDSFDLCSVCFPTVGHSHDSSSFDFLITEQDHIARQFSCALCFEHFKSTKMVIGMILFIKA